MSRGLASRHLMTDFSSNHFQKSRANPMLIKNNFSKPLLGKGDSMLSMRILLCMAGTAALAMYADSLKSFDNEV
jgi:hypothetical protein